jgi:hypothetical protein
VTMPKPTTAVAAPAPTPDPPWPWRAPIKAFAIERRAGGDTRLLALTIDDGIVVGMEVLGENMLPVLLGQLEAAALDSEIQGGGA